MTERDKKTLEKIYEHASLIVDYTSECYDFWDFSNNRMVSDACVFNLLQIGELVNYSLSKEFKKQTPTIPWNAIYGMRNRIVHGYGKIELPQVWETVQEDIPDLIKQIDNMFGAGSGDECIIDDNQGGGRGR